MKVGPLGKLGDRKVQSDIARLSYVARNERDLEEYVLVFKNSIPSPSDEPTLYGNAKQERDSKEIHLTYPDLRIQVFLTNKKLDDEFRKKHPDIIEKYETFRIDEIRTRGNKKEIAFTYGASNNDNTLRADVCESVFNEVFREIEKAIGNEERKEVISSVEVTEEQWRILMTHPEFKKQTKNENPNLGGFKIIKGEKLEVHIAD
jgi:hypothetical protein